MANLTITVDQELLQRARVKATEQGTSVNAVLAAHLAQYAQADPTADALASFLDLADRAAGGSGHAGRQWKREELYDRPRVR